MYKIAIAGVGVVGGALLEIISETKDEFKKVTGEEIEICGYLARKDKNLGIDFYADYKSLIDNAKPDLLVELVGGVEGLPYDMTKYAIESGVSIVSANKALIAEHGNELLNLAAQNNVSFNYEAAVAGAIPIIRTLKNVLNFEKISEVKAILNGTCNFILTKMTDEGASYLHALEEAQKLGYAEADPTLDVDGTDAFQKLKIISSLVTGKKISEEKIVYRGIEEIDIADINYAKDNQLSLKLIAYAYYQDNQVSLTVSPVFLDNSNPLAGVNQNFNVVNIKSKYAKDTTLIGYGAGGFETASAVYADIQNGLIAKNKASLLENECSYQEWLFPNSDYYIRYGDKLSELLALIEQGDVLYHDEKNKYLIIKQVNPNFIQDLRDKYPSIVYLPILR